MRTTPKQREDLLTWWCGVPVERYAMVLDDLNDALAAVEEWKALATAIIQLRALRDEGWTVAVHNDYRLNGEAYTFWLFTRDGRAVKGEGRTDEDALRAVIDELAATRKE